MLKKTFRYKLFIFLGPLCWITLNGYAKTPLSISKYVTIQGIVDNTDEAKNLRTVKFIVPEPFDGRKNYVCNLSRDGSFSINIPLQCATEIYVEYKSLHTLFVFPSDTLNLEINISALDSSKAEVQHSYLKIFGKAKKVNENIAKFLQEYPSEGSRGNAVERIIKSTNSEGFLNFIKARKEKYNVFLSKFISENETDNNFISWANDKIKYEELNDLLRYTWLYPYYTKVTKNEMKLSPFFFSALDNYKMDDFEVRTFEHSNFLNELFKYEVKKIQAATENSNFEGKELTMDAMYLDFFKKNSSGFTQQYLTAHYKYLILKGMDLNRYNSLNKFNIDNEYFRFVIESKYNDVNQYLLKQNTSSANLYSLGNQSISDFFNKNASKFKGKVIYIDFWGPWCVPCMAEMPNSKKLQDLYKNKDVVFLFLANNTTEKSWKATIANEKLRGEHLNLTTDQFNRLSSLFNISGVPHYALIDKKGNIVMNKAPRPSEIEDLRKAIDSLLK